MPLKKQCPRCGKSYWSGYRHDCPAAKSGQPIDETIANTGCAMAEMGCCLAELGSSWWVVALIALGVACFR